MLPKHYEMLCRGSRGLRMLARHCPYTCVTVTKQAAAHAATAQQSRGHLQVIGSSVIQGHKATAKLATELAAAAASPLTVAVEAPTLQPSFADRLDLYDSQGRLQLKNLTLEELQEWCELIGHDKQRAQQLWRAIYQDNRWIRYMDNADGDAQPFAAAFKAAVGAAGSLSGGLHLQTVTTARDGTHKLVFSIDTAGGTAAGGVETVLIPMRSKYGSQLRYTACLSSQVGCAMNCQVRHNCSAAVRRMKC
eukprot:GHRR01026711.1.p1 GENE.GHRR01026711.1~~GHRR01026711.1.p1  ORF type:complete len:249 (+),score=100.20 GHRR01026711.1:880-1626(+)